MSVAKPPAPPPPDSSYRPPIFRPRKDPNLFPISIAAVILFALFLVIVVGGILFPVAELKKKPKEEPEQELDISNLKKPEEEQKVEQEVEEQKEPPPPAPIMENVAIAAPQMDDAPALSPMSLSDLESALAPGGGAGMFGGGGGGFQSGRIGGRGGGGGPGADMEQAFSMADLDQKPRAVYQPTPVYPAALRSRKIEGVVSIIFVVGADGRVANAKVEKSTDPAFDKPALDAVRKWKFEPGVKEGRKVSFKMRAPIRFDPKASS
jgi:protein TonB